MNRRTLTYPIAALAVAAVLVCGWLQTAAAQKRFGAAVPAGGLQDIPPALRQHGHCIFGSVWAYGR